MKELNLQQLENLEGGRKFWGWEASLTEVDSNCSSGYSHTETYYVMGVAVSSHVECTTLGNC
jgi:hypothetical protein